jgi:hypothetical protein
LKSLKKITMVTKILPRARLSVGAGRVHSLISLNHVTFSIACIALLCFRHTSLSQLIENTTCNQNQPKTQTASRNLSCGKQGHTSIPSHSIERVAPTHSITLRLSIEEKDHRHVFIMSNITSKTFAAAGHTSEEEMNFMFGDAEFDIDRALGLQIGGRAASSSKLNGGDMQTSTIDAALEDIEDDLNFDGFDPHYEEFTGLPSLVMPTFGFNFDNFQYGKFAYPPPQPPPPQFYNAALNTGFYPNGFHNTGMPQMFPAPRFSSDLELERFPLFHADSVHAGLSSFDLGVDSGPHFRRPLKKRRVDRTSFASPVVGPSQGGNNTFAEPPAHGPFHLVPIKESAVLDMSEAAVTARKARKIRRLKRAGPHVLQLLGVSASEIEAAAVLDADYNDPYDLSQTQDEQCDQLLRDYMHNFDAKMFVEGLWDGIYAALSTKEKPTKEVEVVETTKAVVNGVNSTKSSSNNSMAANLIKLIKRREPDFSVDAPDDISSDMSSEHSSTTLKLPANINANVSSSQPNSPKSHGIFRPNNIVSPSGSNVTQTKKRSLESNVSRPPILLPFMSNLSSKATSQSSTTPVSTTPSISYATETKEPQNSDMNADLPDGNDPESRRLRRLMRNRLSAQRSRDKGKSEIEAYTKLKAQKDEEIACLKKTLTDEMEGLKKLEEMVNFAKSFLGPAKFAMVTSN